MQSWFRASVYMFFTVLLACFFSLNLSGQDSKLKFESYSTEDGLSQSSIITILQDDDGFMWFGTYGGLNRFDGYNFKIFQYNQEDTNTISDNHIRSICQDTSGVLWVGTMNGLNKFFTYTNDFIRFKHNPDDTNSIADNSIYRVYKDRDGDIWVGTFGGGLDLMQAIPGNYASEKDVKYNIRHFKPEEGKNSISNERISSMDEGPDGSLWIGSFGLNKYNKETDRFKVYWSDPNNDNSLSSNYVSAMTVDRHGYVWAGTWGGGLNRLDPETDSVLRFIPDAKDPYSLSHNIIMSIYTDTLDNIWVGTWGGGLNRLIPQTKEVRNPYREGYRNGYKIIRYQYNPYDLSSISGNSIYSIYEDKTGLIWVGTDWSGVNKFFEDRSKFEHIYTELETENNIVNNVIKALLFDDDNNLWIATQEGLNVYNSKTKTYKLYQHIPGDKNTLSNNHIRSLLQAKDGTIWVGTIQGLNKFIPENGTFKQYFINPDNPGNTNNLALFESSDSLIWIGNYSGGLYCFNPKTEKFRVIQHTADESNTLTANQVWDILEDKDGMLWISTTSQGLCRLNRETGEVVTFMHNPNDTTSILSDYVTSLFLDHNNDIWVGTSLGLNKLMIDDDGSIWFQQFGSKENYAEHTLFGVNGIQEDNMHNLWLTTSQGLLRFKPDTREFSFYTKEDGLQDNEFSINAITKNPKTGEIYAGGINGFNKFYPSDIISRESSPILKIVGLKIFNKNVEIGDTIHNRVILDKAIYAKDRIELSHNEYVISIEYAALHYHSPKSNRYIFKLEGFDQQWNYVGNQRMATYTNLKPGTYTFRVKASNNDNIWNEEGAALVIYIKPPYWQTFWFKSLAILTLFGFLFLFYYLRVSRIKYQNIYLEKTVEERTRELNKNYELLTKRTEELDETNAQLSESNEKLSELNSMKNKFFSIIGHDLKNPINAIMGFTELLQDRIDSISKEKRDDFIQHIHTASTKTFKLLENLLEWARSQSGNMKFMPEYHEIYSILKANVELLKNQAGQKGIDIRIEGKKLGAKVYCDKRMIDAVTRNLVSNALKYTSPGGQVKLQIVQDGKPGFIVIHVIDNGVGIEGVNLDNLFKLDETISTEGTTGETGTGLGLILCKEFIEQNGGEIWVESKPGIGSTFSFSLPLKSPEEAG